MIKLKAHNKPISEFTEIDKYLLVPKKLWDDFPPGETRLIVSRKRVSLRIYDVPCECVPQKHQHRIIDLRAIWQDFKIEENQELSIDK